MMSIPVLMYHHINPHKGDMVTVTPDVFEGQMEYLHKSGYRTLKIDELMDFINGKLTIKEKSVVITFDDAWLDNYIYAFPIIKKYKINSTIFIITGRTERASENKTKHPASVPNHKESKLLIERKEDRRVVLDWNLINEMSDSALVEFYSHTKSHAKCNSLSENELLEELGESKKIIEEKLNKPCPYLCWPYGGYNDAALKIAKGIGYKGIFTTERGVVRAGSNPFAVKRIVVKDNVAWFKKRMVIYTNSLLSDIYLKIKKR
jgi:peptidoglycan/xylan/chitin deacetylase (PgdA/CDA1 family)